MVKTTSTIMGHSINPVKNAAQLLDLMTRNSSAYAAAGERCEALLRAAAVWCVPVSAALEQYTDIKYGTVSCPTDADMRWYYEVEPYVSRMYYVVDRILRHYEGQRTEADQQLIAQVRDWHSQLLDMGFDYRVSDNGTVDLHY